MLQLSKGGVGSISKVSGVNGSKSALSIFQAWLFSTCINNGRGNTMQVLQVVCTAIKIAAQKSLLSKACTYHMQGFGTSQTNNPTSPSG